MSQPSCMEDLINTKDSIIVPTHYQQCDIHCFSSMYQFSFAFHYSSLYGVSLIIKHFIKEKSLNIRLWSLLA